MDIRLEWDHRFFTKDIKSQLNPQCRRIFQQIQWKVVDVVKEIWLTLVHALKGEYDDIKGDSDVVFRKQEVCKKRWERMNVFCMVNEGIRHYSGYFLH